MAIDSKKYREYLHQTRSHPESAVPAEAGQSFKGIYTSFIPFLALEWFLEVRFEALPQGIGFPFGFLLFWAFYYTYLKPGQLETRLKSPQRWETGNIPSVVLGAAIWFVKIVVVELSEVLLLRWFLGTDSKPKDQRPHQSTAPVVPVSHSALPRDIENALCLLGLKDCRDWAVIHKRYRELAKKFHPDLNPELTAAGNRFMIYDGAYRRLSAVKEKYFLSSTKN